MLESITANDLKFKDLSAEEKQARGILGRLSGIIASYSEPTRNGRSYGSDLWEKAFEAPLVKEMFRNGGLPGEIQHPVDRSETDPEKIAIIMPEPPKKDGKGHLVATVDIVDTPCGRVAYQLVKYGFKFGISSRGEGDIIKDFNGNEIVDPDTYVLNSFDLVLTPACEAARLDYITESLNKTRYNKTLKQKLTESINKEDENNQRIMRESLHDIGIDLDESLFEDVAEFPIEYTYTKDINGDHTETFYGHLNVKANSEEEAIAKADKYLHSTDFENKNVDIMNISNIHIGDTKYSNSDLVESVEYTPKFIDNMTIDELKAEEKEYYDAQYQYGKSLPMNRIWDIDYTIKELEKNSLNESLEVSDQLSASINGVMGAYQNANKWLDSVKEFIYSDLSCPFFSSFVHELAHTMPGRFDKFGDILHTMNIEIPYPTTLELDNELTSIDDAFAIIFGCLDSIKDNLNTFIELTDKDFHGMACSAEELLNDIESEYPMLFRLRDKWNQCNGDLVDFDKFVAQYTEHKEDLLESLSYDEVKKNAIEAAKRDGYDQIITVDKDGNYGITRDYPNNNFEDFGETQVAKVKTSYKDGVQHIDIEESLEQSENITYKNTEIIENEDGTFTVTINDETQVFNSLKNAKTWIDMMQPHLKEELYVSAGKMNDKLLNDAVREFERDAGDYGDALSFVKNKFSQYSLNDQKDIARYINSQLSESLKLKEAYYCPICHNNTVYKVNDEVAVCDECGAEGELELQFEGGYKFKPFLNEEQVGRDGVEPNKSIEEVGAEDNTPEPVPEPEKKEEKETTIIIKEEVDDISLDFENVVEKDVNNNINNIKEAVDNNEASDIEKIYEMFNKNVKLEKKLTDLQEQLSASYARETRLKEELDKYKNQIKQLAENSRQVEILEQKLERANSQISEIENGISANEHKFNESMETNNKVKTKLTESIRQRDSRIKSLEEELESTKQQNIARLNENKTLKKEYDSLQESYADAQKDAAQIKEQYSKKLEQKNELIEKYQKIATKAVDRYIDSQAVRLGITSNEIRNKLPKGYGFKDIDSVCESLQEYKLNINTLPFDTRSLKEGVSLKARNVQKELLPRNVEDEITDLELELVNKMLKN